MFSQRSFFGPFFFLIDISALLHAFYKCDLCWSISLKLIKIKVSLYKDYFKTCDWFGYKWLRIDFKENGGIHFFLKKNESSKTGHLEC